MTRLDTELGTGHEGALTRRAAGLDREPAPWHKRALTRIAHRLFGVPAEPIPDQLDILFGSRAIARYLGLSKEQTRGLITIGALPVFKLGGADCARRSALSRYIKKQEAQRG